MVPVGPARFAVAAAITVAVGLPLWPTAGAEAADAGAADVTPPCAVTSPAIGGSGPTAAAAAAATTAPPVGAPPTDAAPPRISPTPGSWPPTSPAAGRTSATGVTIVVPPVAVVLVDPAGQPQAVETNTGRPPGCGDRFFVTTSPASAGLRPARPALADQVMAVVTSTAGRWGRGWHPMPAAG